jgi:hypothetical protein
VQSVQKSRTASKVYRDWDDLLGKWSIALAKIGEGYAKGDANVDPRDGPKTCEYCDQQTFCRVSERLPVSAPGEEGDDG